MELEVAIAHAREVAAGCGADLRDCAYQHEKLADWLDELKRYRATGLKPEDVISAVDMAKIACALHELNAYKDLGSIDRLRELAKAGREGRIFIPPCQAGDKIYQLRSGKHALGAGISVRIVRCVELHRNGVYAVQHQGMTPCMSSELGKTWFLTPEEACKKLNGGETHA